MSIHLEKLAVGIVACSSHEDAYEASNITKTSDKSARNKSSGWQSQKFCTYPQSIVIKLLSGKCRIYKLQLVMHHYKIPTTALFYIGRRNKDGSEVIFSRIGFVEFSDNKSTGFKTRELKTVDLDVEGEYLKMELEKCHVNKMNLYNQVAIIALSVLGKVSKSDLLIDEYSEQFNNDIMTKEQKIELSRREPENAAMWGLVNRQSITQKTLDLSWDLYQDEVMRRILDAVYKAKHDAVEEERFREAKVLKALHDAVLKAGKEVCSINASKEKALEQEDYDTAEAYKNDINSIRNTIIKQMENTGFFLEDEKLIFKQRKHDKLLTAPIPKVDPIPKIDIIVPLEKEVKENIVSEEKKEIRPIKVQDVSLKGIVSEVKASPPINSIKSLPMAEYPENVEPPLEPVKSREPSQNKVVSSDERPLTSVSRPGTASRLLLAEENIPEPQELTAIQRSMFEECVHFFGEYVTRCVVNKNFGLKQRAAGCAAHIFQKWFKQQEKGSLQHIKANLFQSVKDLKTDESKIAVQTGGFDAATAIKSTFKFVIPLIEESREKSICFGIGLLEMASSAAVQTASFGIPSSLEQVISLLFLKCGDINPRISTAAFEILIEIFRLYQDKPHSPVIHCFLDEAVKKKSGPAQQKTVRARLQLFLTLIKDFDFNDHGWEEASLLMYCLPFLSNPSNEVRDAAMDVFAKVASIQNKSLSKLMESTPGLQDVKPQILALIEEKASSGNALPRKPSLAAKSKAKPSLNSPESLKVPLTKKRVSIENPSMKERNSKPTERKESVSVVKEGKENNSTALSLCVFCLETRNEFEVEESLDMHYWRDCPLLSSCPFCHKVVEISQLSKHLIRICPQKASFKLCPRCKEVVHLKDYAAHIAKKDCLVPTAKTMRCPLCHKDISSNESLWRNHFMKDKCPGNVRTIK